VRLCRNAPIVIVRERRSPPQSGVLTAPVFFSRHTGRWFFLLAECFIISREGNQDRPNDHGVVERRYIMSRCQIYPRDHRGPSWFADTVYCPMSCLVATQRDAPYSSRPYRRDKMGHSPTHDCVNSPDRSDKLDDAQGR
jgi:hypothetical protein